MFENFIKMCAFRIVHRGLSINEIPSYFKDEVNEEIKIMKENIEENENG